MHQYKCKIRVGLHVSTVIVEANSVHEARQLVTMQYGDVLVGSPVRA